MPSPGRLFRAAGNLAAMSMMFVLPGCGSKPPNGPDPVAQLLSITLAANSITAGGTVQGTASLTAAAGAGGATVTLSSSNTSVATVPGSVNVAAGAQTAAFTVTGQSAGQVTISGSLGTSQSANLTVTVTVTLVSVSLSTGAVQGPGNVTGTVTLSGPAPSGGTTVGLSSSNSGAATVPSSITVAQGSSTGTFTVNALSVGSNANVTITATLGGGSQTANLSVTATAVPRVADFVVRPNSGTIATGQQCEVQSVAAQSGTGSENLMKCVFDASSSTPQGAITSYIWRFPQTGGIRTISTPDAMLSNQRLNCGSFGTTGATATRNVTLEIVTSAGNAIKSDVPVTFVRNGPC